MTEHWKRHRTNLNRQDLLDDYFNRTKHDIEGLVASALRTKSLGLRDVLARGALSLDVSSEQLRKLVLSGEELDETYVADALLVGELGRVVMLQNILPGDLQYGAELLMLAHGLAGRDLPTKVRRTLVQYHVKNREFGQAETLLDSFEDIDAQFNGYLRAEIDNPFFNDNTHSFTEWLTSFNKPFRHHGLAPVKLNPTKSLRAFDRLTTSITPKFEGFPADTPLVSVVLTAYRPDMSRLLTSVRSIVNQTWSNFELIIVNDCSGSEFDGVFEKVASLDSRIKVINLQENRGTYAARNVGYAASQGEYITGQDDDDWSHPQRIERQMDFMARKPQAIGCRVGAIRCDEDLVRVRVGHLPSGQNASSLLVRREGHVMIGGFLEVRKAADTEYYYRLKRVSGRPIADLRAPLSIIRILSGSLSRGDFSSGWKHASRRSFRSAYEYWHHNTKREELCITSKVPHVAFPHRFEIAPKSTQIFDVVFAADWEDSNERIEWMLAEVQTLLRGGYSVAILNLESARHLRIGDQAPLNDGIQRLINDGTVREVFYDDNASIDLLIVRDPSSLVFLPHGSSTLTVRDALVVADEEPFREDGSDIRYLPAESHKHAVEFFGVVPTWIPQGEIIRDCLELYLSPTVMNDIDWPSVLEIERWWTNRLYFRSLRPVVGSSYSNEFTGGPSHPRDVELLLPADGQYDVRLLGDEKQILRNFGLQQLPEAWTLYSPQEIQLRTFLSSLDYYVYFPHPETTGLPLRDVLVALASGVIVILPKQFEGIFGGAALYGSPDEIDPIIRYMHSDFSNYQAQLDRTRKVLTERFSQASFLDKVEGFLAENLVKDEVD